MNQVAESFLKKEHQLWINGEWVASNSNKFIDVINPCTGDVISRISDADDKDLNSCVSAARAAFEAGAWHAMKPDKRVRVIAKLADLIEDNSDELAYLEALDNGKPLSMTQSSDIPAAFGAIRYYAGWADKINGTSNSISMPGDYHTYTLREPVGVVGLIVPWNFPLVMAAMKLGPALAAGCTCILKPAEDTSMTALRLGELALDAGIPNGVLNILTGYGRTIGAAMAVHSGIDKVAFTGSTLTGKAIARAACGNLKKVTLELGGKAPNIILPDANLEKAIPGSAMGAFFNSGQVCTSSSRLYVHEYVYDQVIEGIVEVANSLTLGDSMDPNSFLGPLISAKQMEKVLEYIEKGIAEGGKIVAGGKRLGNKGFFIQPTVIIETNNDMTIVKEEIFGPVLAVQKFSDVDDVVKLANDSDYGLSAVIWTQNLSLAHSLAKRIKVGNVGINTAGSADWNLPIGGFKQSGWGRENGEEGLMNYLQTKAVVVSLD